MTNTGVDPAGFFASGRALCKRCGQVNDLGSGEALYRADDSTRCVHCGFHFIRHLNRQLAKMRELCDSDTEWGRLIQEGRNEEAGRRLDVLVPPEDEETRREPPPPGTRMDR
jgi:hypothetical protein